MPEDKVEHISFCKVFTEHNKGKRWLIRLADIDDGVLKIPVIDEKALKTFDNRTLIYFNDKTFQDGTVGVWKWSAVPSDTDPDKDFTRNSFIGDIQVTEIFIVPGASSVQDVIEKLKEGITTAQTLSSRVVFCVKRKTYYEGVMCTSKNISVKDGIIHVDDAVLTLPVYVFEEGNVIRISGRIFYGLLECGKPEKILPFKGIHVIIRDIVARHLTWPTVKAIGVTKNNWRLVRDFISAGSADTILQDVAETFRCSEAVAQKHIDGFLSKVDSYISAEDYDSKIILDILERHPQLMKRCEDAVAENYRTTHQEDLDRAEEMLKAVQSSLAEKTAELESKEREIYLAREKLSDLEQSIQEQEQLASLVSEHVRKRIADARSDTAAFIAEMSFAQAMTSSTSDVYVPVKAVIPGKELAPEDIESVFEWEDVIDDLSNELVKTGVREKYSEGFAAFLYSAYVNKMPVLLAGVNSRDIADAFSASISGRTAGIIDCSGRYHSGIREEIAETDDEVFAVINAFRSEWTLHIPELLKQDRYFFIVHPFVEDLRIEPQSMFSYVMPVFTELIADSLPSGQYTGAKREPAFKRFEHKETQHIYGSLLRSMGLSLYTRSRLQAVLTDFHTMYQEDTDTDCLFTLFPYAYITSRQLSSVTAKISDGVLREELNGFAGTGNE